MAWTTRLANARLAAAFATVALLALVALFFIAALGEVRSQTSGPGMGENPERVVIGVKHSVPAGAVIHIDLVGTGDAAKWRCGKDDQGRAFCTAEARSPADDTARFYVTEPGDAYRILNGQTPQHVLYEAGFAEALSGQIRVLRPEPTTMPGVTGAGYDVRWREQERDARIVEMFWVLENRAGAHFTAAEAGEGGGSLEPVFMVSNESEIWLTTRWHDGARDAAQILLALASAAASLSIALWLRALVRRRPRVLGGRVEDHLDAVHGELVRLARLVDTVVVAGGLLLLVGIGATVATWATTDPASFDPGEHILANQIEAVLRAALTLLAGIGVTIWAVVTWDIRRRYRHLVLHLGTQPELL